MVLVGGATRLTESGLSIVEWKPVTGTLPPLGDAAWQAEFDKYQTIPQYRELNRGMTPRRVQDHLLVGMGASAARPADRRRVSAAVPVVPVARLDRAGLARRLWTIFGLGALQGAVGWWMVASGLAERVEVSQYRLATHLMLACVIYVGADLDRAAARRAAARRRCRRAFASTRDCAARAGAGADLSRRAGRGPARRAASTTPGR